MTEGSRHPFTEVSSALADRSIVVECDNTLYQERLNLFTAGSSIPKEELQHVWRDTTQSPVGGGESPACEQALNEVRSINVNLPNAVKLRILAGDRPIDWANIASTEEFQEPLRCS